MDIRIATRVEYAQLAELDHHIFQEMMAHKIDQGEVIIATESTSVVGWL